MSDLSMSEELAAVTGAAPTVRFYLQLQRAFDHFNQMLFEVRMTPCHINLRSSNRHNGYHYAKRLMNTKGEWLDELGMHLGFMALRSVEEVLSTLVHVNRPGIELTPRSWTVAMSPIRRCFSAGIPPG